MNILQVITTDGEIKEIRINTAIEDIKSIYILTPEGPGLQLFSKALIERKPMVQSVARNQIFAGLWHTDKNIFLEIITNDECYIIDVDGFRVVKTTVDETGNSPLAGNIYTKRRGMEETLVRKSNIAWPSLRGSFRGVKKVQ